MRTLTRYSKVEFEKINLTVNLLDRLVLVILPHAVLGSLVEILGICLLSIWILSRRDPKACFKNRTTMRATIALWVV
jgi:hypothetical protein